MPEEISLLLVYFLQSTIITAISRMLIGLILASAITQRNKQLNTCFFSQHALIDGAFSTHNNH
jgi:hypothetical protein